MKCPMIIKIAYDYAYEAELSELKAKKKQYDKPAPWIPLLTAGGIVGAGVGTLARSLAKKTVGQGTIAGTAIGLGSAAILKLLDDADIAEAQKIMKMNSEERTKYLKSKARKKELTNLAEDIKQD